jgi:hypothetical protein
MVDRRLLDLVQANYLDWDYFMCERSRSARFVRPAIDIIVQQIKAAEINKTYGQFDLLFLCDLF